MVTVHARPTVIHQAPPTGPGAITAERYVSSAWMAREAELVWPRMWLFACLERDVAEPGDFAVLNVGNESILVSRSQEGELAAFYNVCQHRGMRLAVEARGCSKNFVCGYHGWTYRPDGRLIVVPDNDRFVGGVDRSARSLKSVRVDSWAGLVWICMDQDAAPLREYLGPVADLVAPYRLEDMTLIGDQTVRLDCNWKAVFDNFGELYHVEHIHPQHKSLFDCPTAQVDLFANGHTSVIIDGHTVNTRLPIHDQPNGYLDQQLRMFGGDPAAYVGRVLDIRGDVQKLRREAGPRLGFDYDGLSDERLSDVEQYNIFPNTMITVQPDNALIARARPHPTDPNRCLWDKFTFRMQPNASVAERAGVEFTLFDPADLEPVARPDHDEFDQDDIIAGRKTMTITIDQDIHLIRDIQSGMRSRGFDTARLCEDEDRIQHYHDWLNYFMDSCHTTPVAVRH